MKASYFNDTVKGPGHGFLYVTEAGATADLEGARFCIKRASDHCCLGRGGWQRSEIFMEPVEFSPHKEGSALAVGPDVVDNLDPRETCRLTLRRTDGASLVCSLQVSEVAYSVLRDSSGTGAIPEPEQEAERLVPPPGTAPPERTDTVRAETAPEPPAVPDAVSEQEETLEHLPLPKPRTGKNSSRILLLGILFLIVAIGGVTAWRSLRKQPPAGTENAPPVAGTTATQTSPPSGSTEPGDAGAAPAGGGQAEKNRAGTDGPLARAREHLAGSADPALGFSLAKELRMKEDGADAAFLLAEDAAGKGNAEAMLMTGIFYDPADSSPSGSIIKDAAQALYWYQQAAGAGLEEAGTRLAALRVWLETEAGNGSAEAASLLKRF